MRSRASASMIKTVRLFALLILLVCAVGSTCGAETVAGYSKEQLLRLGEDMYQRGVLPSGAPLRAIVQGDIELTGAMTTCSNCHLRSGLGSIEGGVLTPPTNGDKLYAPLSGPADIPGSLMKRSSFKTPRPAYSDTTLADSLRNGVGPLGNRLSETMPRYLLDDEAASILISYLKQLSSGVSPGVTGQEIRFATIVSRDISESDRKALIVPLQTYFRDDWNARLKDLQKQPGGGLSGNGSQSAVNQFRQASLDVWELSGSADTWGQQLDEYYRKKPVFAVLGGMVSGPWAPVHSFCETNRIPCIFPVTDVPVVSETDWYTLYLSKGLYQEGETAAKYLSRVLELPPAKKIVQVYRDSYEGKALAQGFADTWNKLGNVSLEKIVLPASRKTGKQFWKNLSRKYPDAVILNWLGPADQAGVESLAPTGKYRPILFVSATMLAGSLATVPDSIRDFTFFTYPTRLPGDDAYQRTLVSGWYGYKNLPLTNPRLAANVFLITNLLSKVLVEMGGDTYRDFFLDIWDGGKDESNASANYPVLSFGPGQRYASKGCYVVTLTAGPDPKVVRQSDWIVY